jgi:hypothetical protein
MKQLEEIFQSRVLAMLKRKGRIADDFEKSGHYVN